jgi:predicted transcriptional regulator
MNIKLSKKTIAIVFLIFSLLTSLFSLAIKTEHDRLIEKIISQNSGSCYLADGTCLHNEGKNVFEYFGFIISTIMLLFSIFLLIFDKEEEKKSTHTIMQKHSKKIDENILSDDEKNIINELKLNDGSAYQSDLIKKLNLSKVKITRILDKLQGKGLIERNRRGMTNVIILK